MAVVKVVLTYEDYAALPNDGKRYEILDGELSVSPAPSPSHQFVALRLASALDAYTTSERLGQVYIAPFDVILFDTTIVQPDVLFFSTDRRSIISRRGAEGAPTLVVEILSAWSVRNDRTTKFQLYARYGVPYYWIVDSDRRTIDVYRLRDQGYAEAETFSGDQLVDLPPFPGLRLDPALLWPST
jgi:Uma2 family endonuclease